MNTQKNKIMKTLLLIHILGLLVCCSCKLLSPGDNVKEFMPGTYIAEWTSEFATSRDTLLIQAPARNKSQVYAITRRSLHTYTRSNKIRPPQYKLTHWTGFYNNTKQTLDISDNGRILVFDPDKNEMQMGNITYKKL